jgi:SAM-dependent methyltransferase
VIPEIGSTPITSICALEDFASLEPWIRATIPFGVESFGANFPDGVEYRKHWEVAQAARTLSLGGALGPTCEILGVGAGNEPTVFWLTNHVRRVFATDLFLKEGWEESASAKMLSNPRADYYDHWNPRRLVTQHMDGRDLRYEDSSFDGVFSSSSIEHFGGLADVIKAVTEIFRVLKPGGIFSVSTEFRLSGPSPGLPGILMFDRDELDLAVVAAAPWEIIGPIRWELPGTDVPRVPFSAPAADVLAHVERFGELNWSELQWSQYPHVVLGYGNLGWTSVHLALRKPFASQHE